MSIKLFEQEFHTIKNQETGEIIERTEISVPLYPILGVIVIVAVITLIIKALF